MQEFKKTIKRVAAIGTSIAMLGMTMTGALAADLSEYPQPFGGSDTIFVLGSNADASDSAAAEDIAMGLPKTGVKAAVSSAAIPGPRAPTGPRSRFEKWEDLPITTAINNTNDGFGNTLDADDLEGFQDTTIDIDIGTTDDDYDVRDEIRFGGAEIVPGDLVAAHTGLTWRGGEEDFAERVFLPLVRNSWGYFYVFEDQLKAANNLSAASNTEPVEIEFLGKLFQLEGTNNRADSLVVNVGQKFYLNAGDTVVVDGKEVTLIQTATSGATLSVDGVREVIAENADERVNGLEIRVEDVSSDEGIEFDSATLFVGEKARETFTDGEEFVGEDEDDPAWTWRLANLNLLEPIMGIRWSLDVDYPEETDNPLYEHPLYEGESVCLPFDYACVEFEGIQIDEYQDYEIIGGVTEDLYWSQNDADGNTPNVTGARVLEIRAKGSNDDGLQCRTSIDTATLLDTDTIILAVNRTHGHLEVYREEQDGSKAIRCNRLNATNVNFGTIAATAAPGMVNGLVNAFRVEFRDTLMDVDLEWHIPNVPTNASSEPFERAAPTNPNAPASTLSWNNRTNVTGNTFPAYGYLIFKPVIGGNNLTVYFETDESQVTGTSFAWSDIEYLGDSDGDSSTKYDIVYGNVDGFEKVGNVSNNLDSGYLRGSRPLAVVDVSGFEENTRTQDGDIILDPEAHQSADRMEFRVPSDAQDFKANIVIRTSGSAGGEVLTDKGKPAAGSTTGPATILDTEVSDLTKYNAIVVGGPAINSVAAKLLGVPFPSFAEASGLSQGEAVIELKENGAKWALVVAGYEAEDTRRAGVVLKNYDSFELSGTKASVSGESLEVSGITVA